MSNHISLLPDAFAHKNAVPPRLLICNTIQWAVILSISPNSYAQISPLLASILPRAIVYDISHSSPIVCPVKEFAATLKSLPIFISPYAVFNTGYNGLEPVTLDTKSTVSTVTGEFCTVCATAQEPNGAVTTCIHPEPVVQGQATILNTNLFLGANIGSS